MRKKILYTLVWLMLTSTSALKAQQIYKYSNEFLTIGNGARALGMGASVVATTTDVYAGFWNPAGLVEIKDNLQLAFMHNEQFSGVAKHDFGAIAFKPNDKSAMALSIIRFGIDDIPNTLNLFQNGQIDYSRITNFSAVDYAFIGSYARKLKIEGLDVGGNVKIIRRIVGDMANAWGFGFDAAVRYKYKKWQTAAVLRDVTSTFNAWEYTFSESDKRVLQTTGNALPSNNLEITVPRLLAGVARKFTFYKNQISIVPEANLEFTFDGKRNTNIRSGFSSIDARLGVEAGYKDFIYFRSGFNRFQEVKEIDGTSRFTAAPSIGVGIKLTNLAIDYALADVASASGTLPFSNVISVRLSINRNNN